MARTPSNRFWRRGEPFVWASGAALSLILLMVLLLFAVVAGNGLAVFWPADLVQFTLADGTRVLGEVRQWQTEPGTGRRRVQVKTGNRDFYGADFRWLEATDIRRTDDRPDALVLERSEYGNFHGFLRSVSDGDRTWQGAEAWEALQRTLARLRDGAGELRTRQRRVDRLNSELNTLRWRQQRLRYRGTPEDAPVLRPLAAREAALKQEFTGLVTELNTLVAARRRATATVADAAGRGKTLAVADIVRAYQPNRMSLPHKVLFYADKLRELLLAEPREANTEGGLFPAIIGTVMMVFLMSVFSFPLGVITAVYLREYAKDGALVRLVRIAVNNLAGIPSIVYGIFGLGFFVYGIGGGLDRLLYPERLPTPTFGTGGILWASLTMALLTVPVVIVASEEALGAIPAGIREGSLALGATRFQTLVRLLLPMASPGIMTGFILAMARAAGEVAPLMITGVVKLAPSLPVDLTFPFVHPERKFMHLGFHIYDIGFQSPNVEAAKPMVFVTTLLLVLLVLLLSGLAIRLRNRMKRKYTLGSF